MLWLPAQKSSSGSLARDGNHETASQEVWGLIPCHSLMTSQSLSVSHQKRVKPKGPTSMETGDSSSTLMRCSPANPAASAPTLFHPHSPSSAPAHPNLPRGVGGLEHGSFHL